MNTTIDNTNTAFQLKGSLFTLTVLHLLKADPELFTEQLNTLIKQTPKFFYRRPIVLDLQKLENPSTLDLSVINQCLREQHIIPVGVRGGNDLQHDAAIAAGLAVLPLTKTESLELKPVVKAEAPKVTATTAPVTQNSKLITQPVRSGQQIYAKNADLIILAPVSPGAELLADGNIHVYSTLRGRALAGITGNQEARIFCQSLDAELISIAGHYWVSEDLQNNKHKNNVHIFLENDRLHIDTF
jgi:septum site-determining protein MinC